MYGSREQIRLRKFVVSQPTSKYNFWHFMSASERQIIQKIETNSNCVLAELSERIMVGIKTTADPVFCDSITEDYVSTNRLERELIHPMLRGKNVARWRIQWSGKRPRSDTYIIYPHEKRNGRVVPVELNKYPRIQSYFESEPNKIILSRRRYVKQAKRRWYEIWVHQDPDWFSVPYKLITPDFASRNSFALDTKGFFPGGTVFVIILKDQDDEFNKYMLGMLNSKVLEFYHKVNTSTFIYAGRYRYWTSYLKDYPLVSYKPILASVPAEKATRVMKLVKDEPHIVRKLKVNCQTVVIDGYLIQCNSPNEARALYRYVLARGVIETVQQILAEPTSSRVPELESILNWCVYGLYELSNDDVAVIERAIR